jgi:hypothetical protein
VHNLSRLSFVNVTVLSLKLQEEQVIANRERDATAQLPLQNAQLQPERRILGFKPKLRLEWQESQSQNKTSRPIIARR